MALWSRELPSCPFHSAGVLGPPTGLLGLDVPGGRAVGLRGWAGDAQKNLSQRERTSGLERSDCGREESQGSGEVCGNCGY